MKRLKSIPKFKTEDEEAEFWNSHDSTEYFDWSKARHVIFPNLKPTSRSISIRIPEYIRTYAPPNFHSGEPRVTIRLMANNFVIFLRFFSP